jgi:hypothetical protein
VTSTEPLNPFCGATETVAAEVLLPITAEAETGEAVKLKSCGGGGGGCRLLPPQAARATERARAASDSGIALEMNRALICEPVRVTAARSLYTSRASPVDRIVDEMGDGTGDQENGPTGVPVARLTTDRGERSLL